MKKCIPFLMLFVCQQANAALWIKPFDKVGAGDPILIEGNAVGDAAGVDLLGGAGIDTAFDGGVSPDTGTFTLDLAEAVVGSGILPTTNLQLAQRQFGAISRDGYITGQGITSIDVLVTKSHDAVTVTGEDYLTLLGQEITQGTISDTHLTAEDFGDFTCDSAEDGCTLDTDSVDANELNATGVEAELEAALDIGGEVTSTGMASTVIADSVTVTGWVMGASTATTPSANDNDTSLATSAFVQTELDSHEPRAIGITIDGGGSAITTGVKGFIEVPYACTITRSTTLADQSGSIVIDVWKDTYANYPPTVADTITASAKPTITTATKAQDATLTGWTTTVAAGDILGFNVDSITTIQRVHEILKCDISG